MNIFPQNSSLLRLSSWSKSRLWLLGLREEGRGGTFRWQFVFTTWKKGLPLFRSITQNDHPFLAGGLRLVDAGQQASCRSLIPPTSRSFSSWTRPSWICLVFEFWVVLVMCTPNLTNFHQGPPQGPGGYPAPPNAGPRFPTYTPAQQRGPSPPQNLGQRPPNAGLFIFCIPLVRVRKPTLQVGPNSTSRCTLGCINNSSNNRPFTRIMCLRLESRRI